MHCRITVVLSVCESVCYHEMCCLPAIYVKRNSYRVILEFQVVGFTESTSFRNADLCACAEHPDVSHCAC